MSGELGIWYDAWNLFYLPFLRMDGTTVKEMFENFKSWRYEAICVKNDKLQLYKFDRVPIEL